MIVKFEDYETSIEKLEDEIEIDFNGDLKAKFVKYDHGTHICVNAVDGWGVNRQKDLGGKPLRIMPDLEDLKPALEILNKYIDFKKDSKNNFYYNFSTGQYWVWFTCH